MPLIDCVICGGATVIDARWRVLAAQACSTSIEVWRSKQASASLVMRCLAISSEGFDYAPIGIRTYQERRC